MPEPTIDEILAWLLWVDEGTVSDPLIPFTEDEIVAAIRAILEQHQDRQWRKTSEEPMPEGTVLVAHEQPDGKFYIDTYWGGDRVYPPPYWMPLPPLPEGEEMEEPE